jgi:hypothetical protein
VRRPQPADPDDAVPVTDDGEARTLVTRDLRVDQELLEVPLAGAAERPEAVPRAPAAHGERGAHQVAVEGHAQRVAAERARVEAARVRARGGDHRSRPPGEKDASGEGEGAGRQRPRRERVRTAGEEQAVGGAHGLQSARQVVVSAAARRLEEGGDVAPRELCPRGRQPPEGCEHAAREQGGVRAGEDGGRDPDAAGGALEPRGHRRGPRLEKVRVAAQLAGEGAEPLDEPGVVLAHQPGEQPQPQPVAQVARRAVGVVGAVAHPARREPGLDRAPAQLEHRVDDPAVVAGGRDAAEPRGSGAREEAHEHRLGLVVRGVAEGHDGPPPPGEAEQEAETLLARQLLHRAAAAARRGEGAPAAEVEGEAEAAGERLDERRVARRALTPQAVVEVGDLDGDVERPARGGEQVQQAGGVRPAGDGRDHAAAWREQAVPQGVGPEAALEHHRSPPFRAG